MEYTGDGVGDSVVVVVGASVGGHVGDRVGDSVGVNVDVGVSGYVGDGVRDSEDVDVGGGVGGYVGDGISVVGNASRLYMFWWAERGVHRSHRSVI